MPHKKWFKNHFFGAVFEAVVLEECKWCVWMRDCPLVNVKKGCSKNGCGKTFLEVSSAKRCVHKVNWIGAHYLRRIRVRVSK